jgi:hypothetical protein
MTFKTVAALLSCPMCETPKNQATLAPSSDDFVQTYSGHDNAALGDARPRATTLQLMGSRLVFGHSASRSSGTAKKAYNPYPKDNTYN